MLDVGDETSDAITCIKASESNLIDRDTHQTGEGNTQGMLMEHCDAKQRQPEQNEIDRDAEDGGIGSQRDRIREHGHAVRCS